MKQNIIFDLDDTLSHCNKYFEEITEKFIQQVLSWFAPYGVSSEQISKCQSEIDLKYANLFGLTSKHFVKSFVETYEHFSAITQRSTNYSEVEFLKALALSVYEQQFEPYPYMLEVLSELKEQGHRLILHTGGEKGIQSKKIEQLQLRQFFGDDIFIFQHKNAEALQTVINTLQLDKCMTWMVGNSLRTDIKPALQVGINTIYIPAANEWSYNVVQVDIPYTSRFIKAQELRDVVQAISANIDTRSA